jgi:hypothetical protein
VSARTQRIQDEAVRYGVEMAIAGQEQVVAGVYSFGIEMGLAIAVAAGSEAPGLLAELRDGVYHGAPDLWIANEMDRVARSIVEQPA